ncbi:MAG TPA: methyltransferase [Bryobacteraceae bacterium]|nr:methyltransferase [Bryobacteraceae bacterium]
MPQRISEPAPAPSASAPAPHERILAITLGFWQSRALAVAAELELADLLADGPLHVDVLAARTKTHGPSLFRLLRALESADVFSQIFPMVFANTPASECLRKNVPNTQWAWARAQLSVGGGVYEGWSGLGGSIRTGEIAFDQVHGCSFWEFYRRNPGAGATFNEAMRLIGKHNSPEVAKSYDWSRFPVIADIGGGIGGLLVDILDAYPSCRGILFDEPKVVRQAMSHERLEPIGGNFFQSVPNRADAYILRWIIHDWSEAQAVALLRKIREAMKPGARLLLLEELIPETSEFAPGKWIDLVMLAITGGRERTEKEYRELLSTAGFALEEVVPTAGPLSILIAKARATA